MRLLVLALLVVGCEDEAPPLAPPAAPPAATATTSAKQRKDCRDACEQSAIVNRLGDAELRVCRARCDGRAAPASAPAHEVPTRITRSPPVSRPPAVQPLRP